MEASMRGDRPSMQFEQIKEYVTGDDVWILNWKATAGRGTWWWIIMQMKNHSRYIVLYDKGRLMKMPFWGLTAARLCDQQHTHVVMFACIAEDKIRSRGGDGSCGSRPQAHSRQNIMEALYKQQTDFWKSDLNICTMGGGTTYQTKKPADTLITAFWITQRTPTREIGYLRSIAKHHLFTVVFLKIGVGEIGGGAGNTWKMFT